MKTLFIIYVLLSVLVVLFCWIVNVELKKQIATLRKANEANVAEIKSRMEEINALTSALAKSKNAKDALDNSYELVKQILDILLTRHGYNCSNCETWLETLEYVKNNDLSKKRSRKKNEVKG